MSNMSEQNPIKASVFVVKILTIGFSSLKRQGCSNLYDAIGTYSPHAEYRPSDSNRAFMNYYVVHLLVIDFQSSV
jgi:hypothetical protein